MASEGSMVQRSAPTPVGNIDVAQQWDQSLGAADRLVACCYMKRRLPVLVPGIYVCIVLQQRGNRILRIRGSHVRFCDGLTGLEVAGSCLEILSYSWWAVMLRIEQRK